MDIIDSFVVTLGLDPRRYNSEIKKYRDDRKQLAEEDKKHNDASEDAQKKLVDGIKKVRNETIGLLFVLAGANGIKDFAAGILTGDAATGRLAKNLGIATEQASAWEQAIKRVGGSAGDIDGALSSMSSAFQSLQLTGSTGHDADFQGLGVTARDLRNPSDALLKIAEASQRMGKPEFNARASRLGIDQNTINLLEKGRKGVEDYLEQARRLGVTTDKDAESSQKFQDALSRIESLLQGKARPAIEGLADDLSKVLENGKGAGAVLDHAGEVLIGIAIVGAAAGAPFLAVAAGIGAIATQWDVVQAKLQAFENWWNKLVGSTNTPGRGNDMLNHLRGLFGIHAGDPTDAERAFPAIWGKGQTGGGAPAPPIPAGSGAGAVDPQRYWQSKGYSANAARGIVAAMRAENSTLDPNSINPTSGAYGLGQWLGPRKAALFAKYGRHPTAQQQLDFMNSEMRGGDAGATRGATAIARSGSGGAAKAMIDGFYRPGPGSQGDYDRAGRYLGGSPVAVGARGRAASGATSTTTQSTSVGSITIYTAATDADGIAHDLRGAMAKRGLVVQANTGLQQ